MKKENIVCVPLTEMQKAFDMTQLSWHVGKGDIESLGYMFKDRASAENDFTLKQIIPYAIIENSKGEILTYSRAGSEKRLSGLKSAGIGGHVNDGDQGGNLYEVLISGLQREVKEEIGVSVPADSFKLAGMINEEETEVGHCHTGVVFTIQLEDNAGSCFDKEINSPLWIEPQNIDLDKFELWSSLAIGLIRKPRRSVHITLVGGQPAVVYNGVVATEPDFIVYVYSKRTKKFVKSLKNEIDTPSEAILLDPVDPNEILHTAQNISKKYEKDFVTVNISSGLKSWSYFFAVVFNRQKNATIFYMDQNNVLWNYRTMTSSPGPHFDMHTLFRLYGNPLENNYRRFDDYDDDDYDCMLKIKEMRNRNHHEFNQLLSLLSSDQQRVLKNDMQGQFQLQGRDSYVEWRKADDENTGFAHIELQRRYGRYVKNLESEHITELLFNSGWFEYEVATILNKWNKVTEICMNCRFPSKKNSDKNEVDIIVNTGTKILFVECKTQISKPTDIDKFRSVVKNYGGMGSKGIFITESSMSDDAKEKCDDNGLLYFSLKDKENNNTNLKLLYELLDKELYNINTK